MPNRYFGLGLFFFACGIALFYMQRHETQTTMVCTVDDGQGTLDVLPSMVPAKVYERAEIRVQFEGSRIRDIRIDTPYQRDWSYAEHGFNLLTHRTEQGVFVVAQVAPPGFATETMYINARGRMLWSQVTNVKAHPFNTVSFSVFNGACADEITQ